MKDPKKYLFWFANEHADFRMAEVESIISLLNTTVKWKEMSSCDGNPLPFLIAELPSDEVAIQIANRSVTLKHITELWAVSTTSDALHDTLKQYLESEDFSERYTALHSATFRFNVEIYCKAQSYAEKVSRIENFSYLPFRGRVDLKNPEITFQYFEFYGTNPNDVPSEPHNYFFGKLIARSQRKSIHDLSLKKRKFIGNTSMDAELSLIMANHARVSENDLVFDPFVGSGTVRTHYDASPLLVSESGLRFLHVLFNLLRCTGSLLVAAAHCGAYVFGVDIDYLMIHGRTKPTRKQNRHEARKDESVLANMKQYNLTDRYLDVIVGDSSLPLIRPGFVLDAIVTDPPYGMREATERIGSKDGRRNGKGYCKQNPKFPKKTVYGLDRILEDLLNLAAAHLKMNGRLVTWIPVIREDYNEGDYIPKHKCFTLVSNCEQVLSRIVSRRLLTFEKTREPQECDVELCTIRNSTFREKYFKYKYEFPKEDVR